MKCKVNNLDRMMNICNYYIFLIKPKYMIFLKPITKWLPGILLALFFSSCYKETILIPDQTKGVLNFMMDSIQEQRIYNVSGLQYEIVNPVPSLEYYGSTYPMEKLEIRGDNTLNFRRKGYSVKMSTPLEFYIKDEYQEKKFKEFKLLALVYDYTYIEYYSATNIFKEVGLWPMYSYLTEVQINNHTQGVYLFIEDPVEYYIKKLHAKVVIRRGYYHTQKSFSANPELSADSASLLANRFDKIYSDIVKYSGKQLYDTLSNSIDLENYFTKMSIDLLLQNGDYDDEIYFYALVVNGKNIFRVFPWDLDDLFSEYPHEIGRSWALSTLFGYRVYNSMDDIYEDVGHKLIFSIEDDLDYKIAKDDYLYSEYLKTLERVISMFDDQTLDRIFDNTETCLMPFYAKDDVIAQSKYDLDKTNLELFTNNLAEKRQMVKDRRKWISDELSKFK